MTNSTIYFFKNIPFKLKVLYAFDIALRAPASSMKLDP